jgi:hypothetical protein
MEKKIAFEDVNPILKPYYQVIGNALTESFLDAASSKERMADIRKLFVYFKPRTLGSMINDCLKSRLITALFGDKNVRIVDGDFFGIVIAEQILIRFNKMDRKFQTSIQKRKKYWVFWNQGELPGFPNMTLLWCGFHPDAGWTKLMGYSLVCYQGGLKWYYDMKSSLVQEQLSFEEEIKEEKKRLTAKDKKKKDGNSDLGKTGTDRQ